MLQNIGYGSAFEDCGSTSASSTGTAIGTGYTQLIAATGFTYNAIMLDIATATTTTGAMLTLARGGSGSEKDLITNILITPTTTADVNSHNFLLPLHVPAGVRLSAKASSASILVAKVTGIGGGVPSCRGFSNCVTMGASSPNGTQIDPGGTANTKGSYSQIVSSTAADFKALMLVIGGNGATVHNSCDMLIDIAVGAAASEKVFVPNLYSHGNATTDVYKPFVWGPFPVSIPASSRLAIRAQSSTNQATNRLFDAVLYGFY